MRAPYRRNPNISFEVEPLGHLSVLKVLHNDIDMARDGI
jgi:hypothetical protein